MISFFFSGRQHSHLCTYVHYCQVDYKVSNKIILILPIKSEFMKLLFLPKYEPNQKSWQLFCSYLGRNDDFINSFWNLLIFKRYNSTFKWILFLNNLGLNMSGKLWNVWILLFFLGYNWVQLVSELNWIQSSFGIELFIGSWNIKQCRTPTTLSQK